jgi:capsular polysaccharide biosynthesis protein
LRNFYLGGTEPKITGNKAIYISRKNNVRGIKDENLFTKILIEFGVEVVYPEDIMFKDTIKMMGNYNHLIGVDGAQLTNMLFMQNNSKICSLKHNRGNSTLPPLWFAKYPNLVGNYYYYAMASNLDFKFYNLYCKGDNCHDQWPNQNLIIPQDLVSHLEKFLNY